MYHALKCCIYSVSNFCNIDFCFCTVCMFICMFMSVYCFLVYVDQRRLATTAVEANVDLKDLKNKE